METHYKGYPLPKTNEQEVLLTLIVYGNISLFDYPYMSGYRARIANLQIIRSIRLEKEKKQKKNKFGNSYTYVMHRLPESERVKAIEIYYKINKT